MLQSMVQDSPFAESYRRMYDVAKQATAAGVSTTSLGFVANPEGDLRRYNHPIASEVAAVFCAEEGAPPSNRDIVIWPKEHAAYRVDERNDLIDPLTYVLLFPEGTPGWTDTLRHHSDRRTEKYTRVTPSQFYAYRLMVFHDMGLLNYLPHGAGLLFQQYLVDVYCRAETVRLTYLRTHQAELRSECYQDLAKEVAKPDFKAGETSIGRRIVLPSSYPGSPRHMHQNYLDAMAMVRVKGKPDYFITMTANPSWPEIVQSLLPGQSPHDRPDIVARVFQLKLKALLEDLTKNGVMGRPVGWTWVVEFQKRGLPHAHILVIVGPEDKPRTPHDVDARVCAEIPDPQSRHGGVVRDRHQEYVAWTLWLSKPHCFMHGGW